MTTLTRPTRRTLIRGAAWSVPVVSVAAAAPAFAASLRKDPGLNGWLQISYGTEQGFDARFDGGATGPTPDGAPFGLYLYDVNVDPATGKVTDTVIQMAQTLWLRGTTSFTTNGGHSSRWSGATAVGQQTKPDGLTYRGYRFDYNGSATNGVLSGLTLVNDGTTAQPAYRLVLLEFDATANNVTSSDATFWVERTVTVNGLPKSFQRRNGERGPLGNGFPGQSLQRRAAGAEVWA